MEDWFTCYKAAMRKFFRKKINTKLINAMEF